MSIIFRERKFQSYDKLTGFVHTKKNGGGDMRIYRCFLVVLIIVAISFGVWYYTFTNNQHRSTKDGTLVFIQNTGNRCEEIVMYGE